MSPRFQPPRTQASKKLRRLIRSKKTMVPFDLAEVEITRLGSQADGLAEHDGARLFVPGTLPGERVLVRPVTARGDGWLCAVETYVQTGPERTDPPCPQFAHCGGCAAQHMSEATYQTWKHESVLALMQRADPNADTLEAEPYWSPPQARRRVRWAAVRAQSGVTIGFHARAGKHIVSADGCCVVRPELDYLRRTLQEQLEELLSPGETIDLQATVCADGAIDLVVWARTEPDMAARQWVADMTRTTAVSRVSWAEGKGVPEIMVDAGGATVTFGPSVDAVNLPPVPLPPGGFLQSDAAAERFMVGLATSWLAPCTRVADLYCGSGTFSLSLSRQCPVWAVDNVPEAVNALDQAARRAGLPIDTAMRDLKRRPPTGQELAGIDGAVVDPPRAGAMEVVHPIINSQIHRLVMVSCNPATLVRDLRILIEAGFILRSWSLVDQFRWSSHSEVVALLDRP